jgi:hypothetical protein
VDITLYNALFGDKTHPSLAGSISFNKKTPTRMTACLWKTDAGNNPGGQVWKAYRSRKDGEGQRQLEEAMNLAAYAMGVEKIKSFSTIFSPRHPG